MSVAGMQAPAAFAARRAPVAARASAASVRRCARGPARPAALRVVAEAASVADRKPSPLERGGTLSGSKALGVDASAATIAAAQGQLLAVAGKFSDPRWVNGTWDMAQFKGKDGETDWDAVIDAEVARRRRLEIAPEPSELEDEVKFDTSEIPWWAWVRRFHLPVVEQINGRAAMIGFATGYFVDALTGAGLVDQTNNFFGKALMWATFAGVAFVRSTKDLDQYKELLKEATFYDKQWSATWEGVDRPSETQK